LILGLVAITTPVTATSVATELRWIAYVRTQQKPVLEVRGDLIAVRSDGQSERTLVEGGVQKADLGPGGIVHATREQSPEANHPRSYSLVRAWIDKPIEEGESQTDTEYYGVAASFSGEVALGRQITTIEEVPPFLLEGIDDLRSTRVPVLVPTENPPGTKGLVASAEKDSYQLVFTNDPEGELAHVEQINVVVSGTTGAVEPMPDPQSQPVTTERGDGRFFCGASACFLTWQEQGTTYTVGEFGAIEEAGSFVDSLVYIEELAGSGWREGKGDRVSAPELIVQETSGKERILEAPLASCNCTFLPLDWNAESDRLLVLTLPGFKSPLLLQEYSATGSPKPVTLFDGAEEIGGRDEISDAAYGPDGVVALLGSDVGPGIPGNLWDLETDDIIVNYVRAFDIEGSTLAYVNGSAEVIVRDLVTGNERTVGEGAIDVAVAPDVISAGQGEPVQLEIEEDGPGIPAIILIVVAGLAILAGAALLFVLRRRGLD
jgi:hypothetical protein